MDGPYGTPSSHIFHAQHAVLIAAGIGVTPFASILQSIMHRYYASLQKCPNCQYSWANQMPDSIMNLKKVHTTSGRARIPPHSTPINAEIERRILGILKG